MKCSNCGAEVDYSYRVGFTQDGERFCQHDSPSIGVINGELAGPSTARRNRERELFKKDTLQPYKQDGSLNKDFVKVYGKPKPVTNSGKTHG